MHINGGCHCENLQFELHWTEAAKVIPARACSCEFCTKHGAVWTSHVDAELRVAIRDPSLVNKYRFATATADFLLCTRCGVVSCAICAIDERLYAVVNVNAFQNLAGLTVTRSSCDFDGEAVGDRLQRRSRNWIPNVRVENS